MIGADLIRSYLRFLGIGQRTVSKAATPPAQSERSVDMEALTERFAFSLSSLTEQALRELIADLNQRVEQLGCVVFEGNPASRSALVIFAGHSEAFFMLSVARSVDCKVICLQDHGGGWYTGASRLPDITALAEGFLWRELGDRRAVFFGQSSGAYGALAASSFHRGAIVLAVAPQTFPDAAIKSAIHFVGVRALSAPDELLDLQALLANRPDASSTRVVIVAVAETENTVDRHFWMDHLHAARLTSGTDVELFVVRSFTHSVVHRNARIFSELLSRLAREPDAGRETVVRIVNDSMTKLFSS